MGQSNKRVVLITGASSGIGQACARYLHQKGYRVYGTSRRAQSLTMAGAGVQAAPAAPFEMIPMDVDSDASVERGVNLILEREGRLDVVVNNAGFGIAGSIEDSTIEEARSQFETNFFGAWRVCRAVLPTMRRQQHGYIVNISSVAGLLGIPFQGAYCAAKYAIEGLTEVLRMEVRPFGIHVVLIEPGDFHTGFTAHRRRTIASQNPAYLARLDSALGVMEADETNGAPPDKIAYLLERIIVSPSPRLRYSVGPFYEKIVITLKKIVPERLFEWGISKYYKVLQD